MIKNMKEVEGNDFNITRSAEEVRNLSYMNHICVGCGKCESTCPVGAIELAYMGTVARSRRNVYFSGHEKIAQNIHANPELIKIQINEDKCVLCGMCSGICPAGALELKINGTPIAEIPEYPHLIKSAEIDDNTCIYCKRCEYACPRDAVSIERNLPNRANLVTGEIEVDKNECIYCGICSEMCPAEAITVNQETGKEDIVIDTDKCVYCLVCKKVCPQNAIRALCRICSYGDYDIDLEDAKVTGNSIIDDKLCIKCGWCEGVCPTGAAQVEKAFIGNVDIIQDKCKTCGACIDVCPCNALAFPVSTGPGQRLEHVAVKDEYCIRCGACEKTCPNDAIKVNIKEVNYTPTNSITWINAFNAIKD